MFDIFKQRSAKPHTSPGTLHYVGPSRDFTPSMALISYNAQGVEERDIDTTKGKPELDPDRIHLVNVMGVHDKELIRTLGQWFDIHPLTLEDAMNTAIRPKVEEIGGHFFVVLKAVEHEPAGGVTAFEQLSLLLKGNVVLLLQENPENTIAPVLERIRKGKGRIRAMGADYLAAQLLDLAVDTYFPLMADLGDRVQALETEIVEQPDHDAVARIHKVKREVLSTRNTLMPIRELLFTLARDETEAISPQTMPFLRDVHDHAVQGEEAAAGLLELLSGLMDLHVSLSSLRMNEVMKVLTIIATIFIPLTFIAGIYGMNFEFMPELSWHYGYFLVMAFMAVVAWIMVRFFKNKAWL